MSYAALDVTTNFSFLRGASHAEELVAQAKVLGLSAIAITDRNTLAGVVRAHVAAKELGLKLVIGARLDLQDCASLLCFPKDRKAYGRLSRLLSLGQARAAKGQCILYLEDVAAHAEGQIFVALPPPSWDWRETVSAGAMPIKTCHPGRAPLREPGPRSSSSNSLRSAHPALGPGPHLRAPGMTGDANADHERPEHNHHHDNRPVSRASLADELIRLKAALGAVPLYLAASHTYRGEDRARIGALAAIAQRCGTPLVASNEVLYHAPHRRNLQDILTCVREHTTIAQAGFRLQANAERHLKRPAEMARLFKGYEAALVRTLEIANACTFSLDQLVYEYPDEPVPPGKSAQAHLEDLTWEGAQYRFPGGVPEKVRSTIERELKLIAELNYAPYFLTVHDIVAFARSRSILCQGRGSAANSVVCYCLSITAVNPTEVDLLFERFISEARREPPDIDVDFEHERREEVIQYIYGRYGRDRAGLAATVISYRARSAVRDVGKAMGLSEDTVSALAGMVWGTRSGGTLPEKHVREAGLDPNDPLLATVLDLTQELMGFPRHLSQHVGGFVLTRGPLIEVVPVGNAAMDNRTFIEWDKDDIAALGLLKVDVLALGMLTCIRKAFELLDTHHGLPMTLAKVPRDDPAVYEMLCRADSLGVFQVESRAQMNMLPRLKPRCFYDLVIEVAIVRPGPIQGDMVHPYLRRRSGLEEETYPAPSPEYGDLNELRQILGKTKGVPLFQEQAMRIAMDAAKFTDAEVNELRKAMATFRRRGTIGLLEEKMVTRMVARGYDRVFAERCFAQIKGFGEYGFPESHAASFAHLVYVSSWLKCHYPAAFACALLNSQPMGFYAPAQIVRDAHDHGVEVRAADINHSNWDCTLETESPPTLALPLKGGGREHRRDLLSSGSESNSAPGLLLPSPLEGEVACPARQRQKGQAGGGAPSLRLGLRQIDGIAEADARKLVAARNKNVSAQEVDEWEMSAPANYESISQTKNASSGSICVTSDSVDAAFADSIPWDPTSSISSVSNEDSLSRSMEASTQMKHGSNTTKEERSGFNQEATASIESGTVTSGVISMMPSKEFSGLSTSRESPPTPALPLKGGGREHRRDLLSSGSDSSSAPGSSSSAPGSSSSASGSSSSALGSSSQSPSAFTGALPLKVRTESAQQSPGLLLPSPLKGEVACPARQRQKGQAGGGAPALRLGLRQIDGIAESDARKLVAARAGSQFTTLEDAWMRAGVRRVTLEKLAAADAFRSIGLDRRQALWEVRRIVPAPPLPLFAWSEAAERGEEPETALPLMALSEHVVHDYQTLRLSLKAHPMSFLREDFASSAACAALRGLKDGARVSVAGVVLVRQRPGSAKGVVFMTIEDETGVANAVVWPKMLEAYRKVVMTARLVEIQGRIQRHEDIIHIVAARLIDRSDWLLKLSEWAGTMKVPLANADEVLHPRFAREPKPHHPRNVRIIPKSRDFH